MWRCKTIYAYVLSICIAAFIIALFVLPIEILGALDINNDYICMACMFCGHASVAANVLSQVRILHFTLHESVSPNSSWPPDCTNIGK